ncbi:MAG: FapA family protein [Spirochaetaceae bacterium]|nr:FapA family protein [Spirochaetaceae bacterium]
MVDFARLQAAVKERLETDRSLQCVEVEGVNLEAAISEAATLLGVPLRHIKYEIIEKQTSFLGIGKDLCKIRAYERNLPVVDDKDESELSDTEITDYETETVTAPVDIDGDIFVQCREDGVYVKITSPSGNGASVSKSMAAHVLNKRDVIHNNNILNDLLKHPTNDYVRIADFKHIMFYDTVVNVEIDEQEMKAFLYVTQPKAGGRDYTYDEYRDILKSNKVVYGINEDSLKAFADRPVYNEKICAAVGKVPVDGQNSYLEYFFDTEPGRVRLSESADGKVNFKELNIIQNVIKDEKLAKVCSAEKGKTGFTVTGKSLPAQDGKDFPVILGKNVRLSDDKCLILSDINGQVVMTNGKINVESVYTIDSSVNLKTGNILFLGNVVINGNVEEGFSVKASGNIEVCGLVDKASLIAEGDIIVRQGIAGKKGEFISAGRSVWAKFIENSDVKAGLMVTVSDGILNSTIDAEKCIICQGKRAAIIGGRLRAGEEINAKSLGSPSGNTETICEVGVDPKRKSQLEELTAKRDKFMADFDSISINLKTLTAIRQQRGTLPEDKEAYFQELTEAYKKTNEEIASITDEINEITEKLLKDTIQVGRVSASAQIYPGVVIKIRDIKQTISSEFKASTFILENEVIHAVKYIETDAVLQQKPVTK